MNIGENIKKIRQWKEIPQKAVSDSTGIPQGTLSKIEGGSDVLWSKLNDIAEALSVSIQDLVCFEASKINLTASGNNSGRMDIGPLQDENESELVKVLKNENAFLRKILEKTVTKNQKNKA